LEGEKLNEYINMGWIPLNRTKLVVLVDIILFGIMVELGKLLKNMTQLNR